MRKFISKEELEKVKSLDVFSYFKNYRPNEIKRNSRGDYILKDHDSLHFSNGKWYWWSQNFGGKNALDYLTRVENMSFLDACNHILDLMGELEPVIQRYEPPKEKVFKQPEKANTNKAAYDYLTKVRMLHPDVVKFFMDNDLIYQDKQYGNVVFIGKDGTTPKYAFKRGTKADFKGEAYGSDKAYSFSFTNPNSDKLFVFESAIDLLSFMSFERLENRDFLKDNFLSLGGASQQVTNTQRNDLPIALKSFLYRNPHIKEINFCLDNDTVGIGATQKLMEILADKFICHDSHPTSKKDINEELVAFVNKKNQNRDLEK